MRRREKTLNIIINKYRKYHQDVINNNYQVITYEYINIIHDSGHQLIRWSAFITRLLQSLVTHTARHKIQKLA